MNKNGKISYNDLKPGDYYFKETAAPAGYNFDAGREYHFTVALQTKTQVASVTVKNSEKTGSVELTKTDVDTGKALPGAVFSLYDKDGHFIKGNLKTDAKGQLVYNGLKPGDYYFVETSAPDGYEPTKEKHVFTIKLQTAKTPVPASLKITNKKIPAKPAESNSSASSAKPEASGNSTGKQNGNSTSRTAHNNNSSKGHLPQTGEQRNAGLTVIGIIIILAVLGTVLYRRKARK
ncbi:SpaA isopeptide-forming pilin-related protein [Liquorilactobacillus oeni]|uniref:Gram-positive cocci surface proteins LPxTG domain-containing protein n=1 Tax=Liquorilactobacillus oeni DSM 19972 TaxID=1423777 RepID=A0A0R1MCB5_9LACO|nr:SpaA isopeptide-forming pilin-related protein [Liquorilactobacillus oeni]KRL05727.1 hypothetical protein FD46_GL000478 [Liquorilactobacillus oeni DSM 19972]